ncbi:uncharacterized protein LOC123955575 [Meles meles]|uniref:uncharacterized protein LOC123955575 n=1 Tax=Meles meles TaxID=9662 RepID=UPI001E69934C|nr:uncharacterized protein LOC123955575 [Meles meles]
MAATWPSGPAALKTVATQLQRVLWFVSVTIGPWRAAAIATTSMEETLRCKNLKLGQYICKDPKINDATQEPVNCTNYTAHVPCFPAPNITRKDFGGSETRFTGRFSQAYILPKCSPFHSASRWERGKGTPEMAIHTRWQLHRLFSSDGWEQTDFTLDTLPWDLGFLDFNRALSVCEFPDFPFSSSNTTSWILCNSVLFCFVVLLKSILFNWTFENCVITES